MLPSMGFGLGLAGMWQFSDRYNWYSKWKHTSWNYDCDWKPVVQLNLLAIELDHHMLAVELGHDRVQVRVDRQLCVFASPPRFLYWSNIWSERSSIFFIKIFELELFHYIHDLNSVGPTLSPRSNTSLTSTASWGVSTVTLASTAPTSWVVSLAVSVVASLWTTWET